MSNDKNKDKSLETGAEIKQSRRKVLRNTLLGGTVVSTSVLQENWTKPILNAVITPSHAQTSVNNVMMSGSVSGLIVQNDFNATDVLDLFVEEAHAIPASNNLDGGCLTITIDGATSTAELTLNNGSKDTKMGTVAGTAVTVAGLHGSYGVSGTLNSAAAPTACSGSVSGSGESANFSVSTSGVGNCTPVAPTTTSIPQTTIGPTTTTTTTTSAPGTTTTTTGQPNANSNPMFTFAASDWQDINS